MLSSPFEWHKWETDAEHIFYVEPDRLKRIEARSNIYIVGSRGTGKTTLLKALDWKERLTNESLGKLLSGQWCESRQGPFLGVYVNPPELMFQAFEDWLANHSANIYTRIFGLYLELVWLQETCDAVATLLARGAVGASPKVERSVVRAIVDDYQTWLPAHPGQRIATTMDLRVAFRRVRAQLEHAAGVGADPVRTLEALNLPTAPGESLRRAIPMLLSLCRADGDEEWYAKLCLDQAEYLSEFQLRIFNTLVRGAQAPIYFVLAVPGKLRDIFTTVNDGVFVQDSDRILITLAGSRQRRKFREFAEGVINARIDYMRRKSVATTKQDVRFDLDRVFGRLDINALLLKQLKLSESVAAEQLLADAERLSNHVFFRTHNRFSSASGIKQSLRELFQPAAAPPIYEAYLIKRLDLHLTKSSLSRERRRQASAELRKRMVAAYLSISHEFGFEPVYSSSDVLLGLCDGCIRDFLRFTNRVWELDATELDQFLQKQVPHEIQDTAFKDVSHERVSNLPESGVLAPDRTSYLVTSLAELTRQLQTASDNWQHLRSSERGIFRLPIVENTLLPQIREIVADITEAASFGYLRLIRTTGNDIVFRVHASLAPAFGFSYRGAYYRHPISWDDVIRIRKHGLTPALLGKIATNARAQGRSEHLDLFAGARDD